MNVLRLTDDLVDAYQAFVDSHPCSLFYHTVKFKNILVELLNCEPVYLVAIDGEAVVGVLPLMINDGPFGKIINSLPFFGSNGGILAADGAAERALWARYAAYLSEAHIASATVIANPLLPDRPPPVEYMFTDSRIGQITSLHSESDLETALLSRIASSARRNLSKAESSLISVAIENSRLNLLAEIHRENMAAIGGRIKPAAFFEILPKYLDQGRDYNVYVAKVGEERVAALLLLYHGKTVEYYIPATRLRYRPLQPSAAILYRAMLDAAECGFVQWNWGGTWLSQEGVLRFKRKWGAVDRPYRYYVTVNDQRLLEETPQKLSAAYPYFYVLPFNRLRSCLGENHDQRRKSRDLRHR